MFEKKCRQCKALYQSDTFASRYCPKCKKQKVVVKKIKRFKLRCFGCKTIYESDASLSQYCDTCKPTIEEIRKKEKSLAEEIRKQEQGLKFENKCYFCKRLYRTNNITSNYCNDCIKNTVVRKCEFCNQKYRFLPFEHPICKSCLTKRKENGKMIAEAIAANKLKKLSTSIQS